MGMNGQVVEFWALSIYDTLAPLSTSFTAPPCFSVYHDFFPSGILVICLLGVINYIPRGWETSRNR